MKVVATIPAVRAGQDVELVLSLQADGRVSVFVPPVERLARAELEVDGNELLSAARHLSSVRQAPVPMPGQIDLEEVLDGLDGS